MYSLLREICARHLLIHVSNIFHSRVSTDLSVQALKHYLVFYRNTMQSFNFLFGLTSFEPIFRVFPG